MGAQFHGNETGPLQILERWLTSGPHARDTSESRLAANAQSGDRRAFDALVASHETGLRGFIARRVAPSAVDDILQETWIAAWNSIRSFRGKSRFKAWIYQIAVHKCADSLRTKQITTLPIHEPYVEASVPGVVFDNASDNKHDVGAALRALPDAQRDVIELYYYADLTLAEIAETLDRNLNTVKYHFYKAHTAVAGILSDREDRPIPSSAPKATAGRAH